MKLLYLVRHAKSSWKNPDLSDFDRPLNKRGKRDAPFMGKLMFNESVKPDALISSPAVRALTTAKIFAEEMGYKRDGIIEKEEIYEAGATELMEIINSLPEKFTSVMLFGHNPGFTSLSNYLSDRFIDNIPTCAVAAIEFNTDKWSKVKTDTGTLKFFEYPKKYFQ